MRRVKLVGTKKRLIGAEGKEEEPEEEDIAERERVWGFAGAFCCVWEW